MAAPPLPGKVLVVGATGQTGKMLVKELLENGSNAVEKVRKCFKALPVESSSLYTLLNLEALPVESSSLYTFLNPVSPNSTIFQLVAYGNSRLPIYEGPNASKFTAMQAPMADLSTTRSAEVRGFDTIFVHVGTQRRKVGLEAQQKLEVHHPSINPSSNQSINQSITYLPTRHPCPSLHQSLDIMILLPQYDHTLAVCKAAKEGGCKTCHIVSSQVRPKSSTLNPGPDFCMRVELQ